MIRWHLSHWKIQVHAVQSLKRWLFTRCEYCGKGFRWGAAVHTGSWYGKGPRWFRGEPHVHHSECRPNVASPPTRSEAGAARGGGVEG